jgi:transcription elongation factor Elf1
MSRRWNSRLESRKCGFCGRTLYVFTYEVEKSGHVPVACGGCGVRYHSDGHMELFSQTNERWDSVPVGRMVAINTREDKCRKPR